MDMRALASTDVEGMRALIVAPTRYRLPLFDAGRIVALGLPRRDEGLPEIAAHKRTAFPVSVPLAWPVILVGGGHEVVNNHDKGTGATRRDASKIRADRVDLMVRRGELDLAHARAAADLELVVSALVRGMGLKASSFERSPGGSKAPRDPLSSMRPHETAAYHRRYLPWLMVMRSLPIVKRRRQRSGRAVPAGLVGYDMGVSLALRVCCDNAGLSECDAIYGLRNGEAKEILALTLHRYAVISGWFSGPKWLPTLATRLTGEI